MEGYFQGWADVATMIVRCSYELEALKKDRVFVGLKHVGTRDCEGGYGWRMVLKIEATAVDEVCCTCGYNPRVAHNENRYRDSNHIPENHRHSWRWRDCEIASLITDRIEEATAFIFSLPEKAGIKHNN